MTVPSGALINSAISLTRATASPSSTNLVGAATSLSGSLTGDPSRVATVTNTASLVGSAATLLSGGTGFSAINSVNTATRLAQGFLDPNTAAVVGQVSGGLNQLFGLGGILNQFGFGQLKGNKPVALHSDELKEQTMTSAYSRGQDLVFSFVRADSGNSFEDSIRDDPGIDFATAANTDLSSLNLPTYTPPTGNFQTQADSTFPVF